MKLTRILSIVSANLLLAGCASSTKPLPPVVELAPVNALQSCPMLEPLKADATMGDLVMFTAYVIGEFNVCAARHDSLADYIKKAPH